MIAGYSNRVKGRELTSAYPTAHSGQKIKCRTIPRTKPREDHNQRLCVESVSYHGGVVIPYGRHDVDAKDIDAVIDVLSSEYLTQGPVVRKFEEAVSRRVGATFGVVSNSATSSLHLACLALGVGPGDFVWTSAITFVASANCAVYCGARVDFVDIDPETWNMSPTALREKLEVARRAGGLPKVVIPVHLGGSPCAMAEISMLAREYGFRVVEDASHALGAVSAGQTVGSCEYSDITVFSFHPVKMMTTAEGGMATTNDEALYSSMVRLRSHGITRAPEEMQRAAEGPWYYEQLDLGFNYRMPDLFAALGMSQLRRLDQFLGERQRLHQLYVERLGKGIVRFQKIREDDRSSRHLEIVMPDYQMLGTNQRELFERLRSRGILVNLHYIPVYRHPFHADRLVAEPSCPHAEDYYRSAVTLPLYSGLTESEVDVVCRALAEPLGHQSIF